MRDLAVVLDDVDGQPAPGTFAGPRARRGRSARRVVRHLSRSRLLVRHIDGAARTDGRGRTYEGPRFAATMATCESAGRIAARSELHQLGGSMSEYLLILNENASGFAGLSVDEIERALRE